MFRTFLDIFDIFIYMFDMLIDISICLLTCVYTCIYLFFWLLLSQLVINKYLKLRNLKYIGLPQMYYKPRHNYPDKVIYLYIYIQDPGPGALVPILSSMARQGHFSALWIWAKGCDMEFSRSSKFFSRFFHHKFEILWTRRDFFSIHINFFMRIQWNGSQYLIFGYLWS